MNRTKIQVILLILQLETDYFSSYLFQKCSIQSSGTTVFTETSRTAILHEEVLQDSSAPILQGYPYTYIIHQSREFSIQNPILHAEDKELFEYYYYLQRAKRPSVQKRNSTHRRQGDLLEIHPCVLQDLPKAFQAFQPQDLPKTFQTFQSFMTFQPFQAILQVPVSPGNPPHSSILQLECIFYIFYIFYNSTVRLVSTENSTEYQLDHYKHYKHSFFKEREMLRYRSELTDSPEYNYFLQSSCQVKRLIARMTYNSFLSCLMSKESMEIAINTSKWHEHAKQWNGISHISLIC